MCNNTSNQTWYGWWWWWRSSECVSLSCIRTCWPCINTILGVSFYIFHFWYHYNTYQWFVVISIHVNVTLILALIYYILKVWVTPRPMCNVINNFDISHMLTLVLCSLCALYEHVKKQNMETCNFFWFSFLFLVFRNSVCVKCNWKSRFASIHIL